MLSIATLGTNFSDEIRCIMLAIFFKTQCVKCVTSQCQYIVSGSQVLDFYFKMPKYRVRCRRPFDMMTSSNGNSFRVTGPLCGEFTGPRWIALAKASDAELWCWYAPWINCWVNNREAGDLRCHRAHYDVTTIRYWDICRHGFHRCWLHIWYLPDWPPKCQSISFKV